MKLFIRRKHCISAILCCSCDTQCCECNNTKHRYTTNNGWWYIKTGIYSKNKIYCL